MKMPLLFGSWPLASLLIVSLFAIPITSVSCKGKAPYVAGKLVADEVRKSGEAKEREEQREQEKEWQRKHKSLLVPSPKQMALDNALDKFSQDTKRGGNNK